MLNRYLLVFTVFISGFGLWMVLSPPQAESANHADIKALIQLPDVQITVDQVVASGFSSPVQVANAGDGSGRLFVVEQTGKIRIIKNGAVLPSAFLNLSSLIACCGERGLLGVAFHPDYSSNGFFFVDYTRAGDGATVVAR
jgi:glucose/arabinose dehydrogenase